MFTLSPVYSASSSHTALADRRSSVGPENFFLLCFCRKCSWLRTALRKVLGFQAPVLKVWVEWTPTTQPSFHYLLAEHAFLQDRSVLSPGPHHHTSPGPSASPLDWAADPITQDLVSTQTLLLLVCPLSQRDPLSPQASKQAPESLSPHPCPHSPIRAAHPFTQPHSLLLSSSLYHLRLFF